MANSITPPPELSDEQVGNWLIDDDYPWEPSEPAVITITPSRLKNVARQAFQAGADQELEACCEWLQDPDLNVDTYKLRAARRPKPPSLKEQAYDALDTYIYGEPDPKDKERTYNTIRRALEALPND
jgi:hypothetical protein